MIPQIFAIDGSFPWWNYIDIPNYAEGRLTGCTKATAREVLNGEFVSSLTIPYDALYASQIARNSLITLRCNEYQRPQIFRVSKIGKTMANGLVNVSLNHISYDLNKAILRPFTVTGTGGLSVALAQNQLVEMPFIFYSSIQSNVGTIKIDTPTPYRQILGGMEGSILDTWHGEYEWDNTEIWLANRRGEDRGVIIQDGKNLLDYSQEDSVLDTYSYAVGYWEKDGVCVYSDVQNVSNPYVYNQGIAVDFSQDWDEQPTQTMLNNRTRYYINNMHPEQFRPNQSITVDFKTLKKMKQFEMLANLENIQLGDTVRVINKRMGVDMTARVIEYEWDVLADEYSKVTIGNFRPTLVTTIADLIKAVR